MSGGRTLNDLRLRARGNPDDPATQAEIEQKLARAAKGVIEDEAAALIVDLVDNIEQLSNVCELTTLLASRSAATGGIPRRS